MFAGHNHRNTSASLPFMLLLNEKQKKKVKLVMDSWPVCIGTLLGDHHAIFVFTSNMRDHSYKTVTALVTVLRQLNLNYAE